MLLGTLSQNFGKRRNDMGVTEAVFFIMLTLSSTGDNWRVRYTIMPDMEACQECLKTARINIPTGGDAEAAVIIYCAKNKPKKF